MSQTVDTFFNLPCLATEHPTHESKPEASTNCHSCTIFELSEIVFAIPSHFISAIIQYKDLSQIPFVTSKACPGFIPHNGNPIPVIDLAHVLDLNNPNLKSRILIFKFDSLLSAITPDKIIAVEKLRIINGPIPGSESFSEGYTIYNTKPVAIIALARLSKLICEEVL